MPFDVLIPITIATDSSGRISQRDILTQATKLRNTEIYSLKDATIVIKDRYNNNVIYVEQSDTAGKVEFGDDAWVNYISGTASFTTLSCTTLNATTITGLYTASEMWMGPLIPQWTGSWTELDTYRDVTGSLFDVHWEDFATGWDVFFDMVGKTDAGTGYYQIYNTSDSGAITGSEITTTSTAVVDLRSSALTIPTALKTCKVQHKIVGGNGSTEKVNSIMARLVVRLS